MSALHTGCIDVDLCLLGHKYGIAGLKDSCSKCFALMIKEIDRGHHVGCAERVVKLITKLSGGRDVTADMRSILVSSFVSQRVLAVQEGVTAFEGVMEKIPEFGRVSHALRRSRWSRPRTSRTESLSLRWCHYI